MRLCVCLLAIAALAHPVLAVADSVSDADIAQHYFATGREAFAQGRLEEALEAFHSAARLVPGAELDYQIGLCAERLGRREEAISAYDRFLHADHDSAAGADVEQRIRALRGTPVPHRTLRVQTAAISMAAATVALAVVAGGLIGTADTQYDTLHSGCGATGQCSPSSYHGTYETDVASKVLFGLAGVAAVADVVLWVKWARTRHGSSRDAAQR